MTFPFFYIIMVSPLCMSIGKWKKPWKTKLLLNSVLYNTYLLENYLTYDGNQKTCLFLLKTFWSGCHINQENKRNQKAKHLKKGADGNQKKSRVLHEFKTDHFSHHFPYRFSLFWFFWFHIVILISEKKMLYSLTVSYYSRIYMASMFDCSSLGLSQILSTPNIQDITNTFGLV